MMVALPGLLCRLASQRSRMRQASISRMLHFADSAASCTLHQNLLHIFGKMHPIDRAICTYTDAGECQQLFQVLLIGIKGMHHSSRE